MNALADWEREWRRMGLAVADQALPGATDAELAEAEERTGLRFPDELRAWYHWHSGTTDEIVGVDAAPGWHLISVGLATQRYVEGRDLRPAPDEFDGDPEQFWPRSYFPIAKSAGGGTLVVDCAGPVDEPAPVDEVNHHAELPAWPLSPLVPSVTELVEIFVEVLRDGWAPVLDGDKADLVLRFGDLPAHLRANIW